MLRNFGSIYYKSYKLHKFMPNRFYSGSDGKDNDDDDFKFEKLENIIKDSQTDTQDDYYLGINKDKMYKKTIFDKNKGVSPNLSKILLKNVANSEANKKQNKNKKKETDDSLFVKSPVKEWPLKDLSSILNKNLSIKQSNNPKSIGSQPKLPNLSTLTEKTDPSNDLLSILVNNSNLKSETPVVRNKNKKEDFDPPVSKPNIHLMEDLKSILKKNSNIESTMNNGRKTRDFGTTSKEYFNGENGSNLEDLSRLNEIFKKSDEIKKKGMDKKSNYKKKSIADGIFSKGAKNPFKKNTKSEISKNTSEDLMEILNTLDYHEVSRHFAVRMETSTKKSFFKINNPSMRLNIFKKIDSTTEELESTRNIMDIIESCEFRQINMSVPNSQFEEWIQWTKDKKLWKFPIDNEQDSKELEIGFHEHVFPQQYLSGTLPTTGMIGQFMNYVCIGLSQSPHLTVQQKKDHVKWYEDYFANKLDELELATKKNLEDKLYEENLRNKE